MAKVPVGPEKVALQGVSRQWRDVLRRPEAHSVDTWLPSENNNDDPMPPNPTALLEDGGTEVSQLPRLCPKVAFF